MKHVLSILTLMALLVVGCGTVHPLPSEHSNVTVVVKDSIHWIDSTIYVQVPVERYVDIVPVYDTLLLESTLARSVSYVDTSLHVLKGKLEHKPEALKTTIKYKDRIVTEYRDSIVVREIPVEVKVTKEVVPAWCWWLLGINVLLLIGIAVKLYLKFIK